MILDPLDPEAPDTVGAIVAHAIQFAAAAHLGQIRKASGIPYVWHPLAVGRLLTDHGCREEVVAAGILHDVLEDTPTTPSDLEARFGPTVRALVEACSEMEHGLPWEERKRRAITTITSSVLEARLIAAADKTDNLRATQAELAKRGEETWQVFRRGRTEQEWYYRGMSRAVRGLAPDAGGHPLFELLDRTVVEVFG